LADFEPGAFHNIATCALGKSVMKIKAACEESAPAIAAVQSQLEAIGGLVEKIEYVGGRLPHPFVLASVGLTTLLQLMLLYVPWLSTFFGTRPLALDDLLVCIGFSMLFFVFLEAEKGWRLWRLRAHADAS